LSATTGVTNFRYEKDISLIITDVKTITTAQTLLDAILKIVSNTYKQKYVDDIDTVGEIDAQNFVWGYDGSTTTLFIITDIATAGALETELALGTTFQYPLETPTTETYIESGSSIAQKGSQYEVIGTVVAPFSHDIEFATTLYSMTKQVKIESDENSAQTDNVELKQGDLALLTTTDK